MMIMSLDAYKEKLLAYLNTDVKEFLIDLKQADQYTIELNTTIECLYNDNIPIEEAILIVLEKTNSILIHLLAKKIEKNTN
ncbi:hypothetical protein [Aquimarina rhabdastrellae]